MSRRNEFLDHGLADVSDGDSGSGYDSEAAEVSRTEKRGVKRRKLSHSSTSSSDDEDESKPRSIAQKQIITIQHEPSTVNEKRSVGQVDENEDATDVQGKEMDYTIKSAAHNLPSIQKASSKKAKKEETPGVVYLSSLPPYLKPSALRNLLGQRGFEPITRLFLAPSSKHKHSSKKNSRQLYAEGWIEFASKKTASRCAQALNAQLIGGRKGGFYYDDLWNMKYLRGMNWEELMAGIREEKREAEGRRDEERRRIAKETEMFVRGVEKSKEIEGMKRKRQKKDGGNVVTEMGTDSTSWKQHQPAKDPRQKSEKATEFKPEVQQVLAKIF